MVCSLQHYIIRRPVSFRCRVIVVTFLAISIFVVLKNYHSWNWKKPENLHVDPNIDPVYRLISEKYCHYV